MKIIIKKLITITYQKDKKYTKTSYDCTFYNWYT